MLRNVAVDGQLEDRGAKGASDTAAILKTYEESPHHDLGNWCILHAAPAPHRPCPGRLAVTQCQGVAGRKSFLWGWWETSLLSHGQARGYINSDAIGKARRTF